MLNKESPFSYFDAARKQSIRTVLMVLALIFLPLWLGASYKYKTYLMSKYLSQNTLELSLLGNSLSFSISKRLALLDGLVAFAKANPTESLLTAEFETFANGLYTSTEGIKTFTIAPDGIVRYVYPLNGNEKYHGYDLINDKRHNIRKDVQRTISTKKAVLSVPHEITQGGTGLIVRKGVFKDGDLWGIVTMVLDMTPIFDEVGLFSKLSNIRIALRTGPGSIFYGDNDVFQLNPLIMKVRLTSDVYWELAGTPVDGRYSLIKKDFYFFQGGGFIIVFLLTALTYLLMNRQKLLQLKVHQRTKESQGWWEIFKNADWGVVLLKTDRSTIELINPAYAKMHGYTVDELIGEDISKCFLPDFRNDLSDCIDQCHESGSYTFEKVHIRKDGTRFPAHHDITSIKDGENKVQSYIFNVRDVSERRQIEEELKKHKEHLEEIVKERTIALLDTNKALLDSENRYRSLSNAAFEGIALTENREIIECNEAMSQMFGYKTEELVGMTAVELVVPEEIEHVKKNMASGIEEPYRSIGLKKDGTRFPVEVHAKIFSYQGREIRVSSVRDMTEYKRAVEALSESENKYQYLYDNAPDMFGSIDAKTAKIIQCNQTLANVLGYSKEEIIGREVFDIYTTEGADYSRKHVFPEFMRSGIIKDEELKLQRRDGSTVDVSLNVTAFRDEAGTILYSNSVWRDITERKQAEKALGESERMQGVLEMAGAVCHELNQPIMAISGFTELILMKISKEDPLFEKVTKIAKQSERLGKITLKLMNITKYSTKDYPEGQIIDIDKSSAD